jgi:pimeloyl-ACP methyl ester carboxylesterase
MGGLVVRSAALHARRAAARWLDRVQATVYLGTPHRGAPLERAGAWAQARLRRRAVTAPFASLAGLRSQGIQDLGRAAVAPDGPGSPGDAPTGGSAAFPARRVLCVAGAMAEGTPAQGTPAWDAVGDGLVPVSSALAGAAWRGEADRRVFEGVGHIEMLQAPAVAQHVCAWLAGPAGHGQITAPRAANP